MVPSKSTGSLVKRKSYKGHPSMSNYSQQAGQTSRNRRQDSEQGPIARVDTSGDDKDYSADFMSPKHRKRKRSRKGLDKNFFCPQEDCGKSYSRAEHLYRHQLNRNYFYLSLSTPCLRLILPGRHSKAIVLLPISRL